MLKKRTLSNVIHFLVLLLVFLISAAGHCDETYHIFSQPYAPPLINELRPLPPNVLSMMLNFHGIQGKSVLPVDLSGYEPSISYEKFMRWVDTFFLSGRFKDYSWKVRSVSDGAGTSKDSSETPPGNNNEVENTGHSDTQQSAADAGTQQSAADSDTQQVAADSDTQQPMTESESIVDEAPVGKKKHVSKRRNKKAAKNSANTLEEELRLQALKVEAASLGITWEEVTTDHMPESCPLIIWMIMHEVDDALRSIAGSDEVNEDFSEALEKFDPALELVLRAMLEVTEGSRIAKLAKLWIKHGLIINNNHLDVESWLLKEKDLSYFNFEIEDTPLFYENRLRPWGKSYMIHNGVTSKQLYANKLNKKDFRSQVLWNLLFHFSELEEYIENKSLAEFKVFENTILSVLDDLFRETSNMKHDELALMVMWLDMEIDRCNIDFNWRDKLRELRIDRSNAVGLMRRQKTSLSSHAAKRRKSEDEDKDKGEVKRKRSKDTDENSVSTKSGRKVVVPVRFKE
ncbi:hypothetical protein [Endozoicomonas sp. 8E]|uniref:hypothetical protein n=1 Tax=Endozoicomonas sp. 8E TaxID=3035692 RepID=UPI002938EBCF|nr:hypothetical protein [Endozoicomonas sp. 8E]WOG28414.1 hypothetical protein P6910_01810 [Endozoicomonas sp. 8E]